jgi:hypothetical protein
MLTRAVGPREDDFGERLHPSGWMIECVKLPPASWVQEVVRGSG